MWIIVPSFEERAEIGIAFSVRGERRSVSVFLVSSSYLNMSSLTNKASSLMVIPYLYLHMYE